MKMDIPLYYNRSKITSDKNLSVCEVRCSDGGSIPPRSTFGTENLGTGPYALYTKVQEVGAFILGLIGFDGQLK